jgi:hypothetical protein
MMQHGLQACRQAGCWHVLAAVMFWLRMVLLFITYSRCSRCVSSVAALLSEAQGDPRQATFVQTQV